MGDSNSETALLAEDFQIPTYMLKLESEVVTAPNVPACPVIVFINSKSAPQVFDLGDEAPDMVLHKIYVNLEKLKLNGDEFAGNIEKHLRLIVAGGDGTAGWLLGVVCDLKLSHPPPIATVPLGTGNNPPFAFGWGRKNPRTDDHAVKSILGQDDALFDYQVPDDLFWHILDESSKRRLL